MYFNKEIIFKNQKSQSVAAIHHLQKIYLLTKTRAECQLYGCSWIYIAIGCLILMF
uniref:Uncharacterized protein n=1 Tax=Candidatus Methanogaster sp. ANME-2c ERB4 TaxID=2759911 RepID=A0A7G9YND7_9EURY|nr:hypothetical protein FBKNMHLG_00040 [Methanosarcinales archaeon ANME-2c ERB4]